MKAVSQEFWELGTTLISKVMLDVVYLNKTINLIMIMLQMVK